ncbi:unnamed protein product [Caenorhabditis auriculariae]|uniref:Retinoblastoma-associated protein N-terminal domain-containing protein n=1 Tax=Caenorhabditis auriculariae TaxID=2777116 RepID=A0A8S1HP39_9PELO|nr:unnamed protein product [Caenorhabditis auriculariae]
MPKRAAPLPEIKLELHGEEEEVYEEDFEKTGVIYQAPGSPYKNGCLEEEEDFSHSSYNDTDDGQDEEFFATNIEVPDPSIDFLEKCHGLGLDPNSQVLLTSWELYFRASQQVLLEGDPNAWKAAAIYYYLLNRGIKLIGKLPKVLCVAFPFEAGRILTIFNISAIELFDKVARFTEILSTRKTRRIAEFTRRNQESLALSSVVFKKFLPIFRRLFCLVKEDEASKSTNPVSTSQLFSLIWVSYLMMKRFLPNEELLNDFQLLLCIIDAIYCDMCQTSLDVHFNNDFAQDLLNRSETVLEALCSEFDGAILEAKLFRENFYWKRHTWSWLPDRWDVVENCAPGGLLDRLNETYNTLLLRRGQLDERLFVPDNIELVFDEAYDESAVEVLKRGPDNRVFEDAQLLMTISAQNCLERVTEGKFTKPLEYTRNCTMPIDKLCNSTLLGEQHNIEILKDFVAEFQLDTSSLKKFSQGFPESPLNLIIEFYDQFQAELLQRVEDDNKWDPNFDTDFSDGLSENLELLKSLYLRFVDLVVVTEVERGTLNIYILGVLKRKEFAKCIYVAALELVLFANSSQRQFPWSAQTCGLEPFVFHRIIDVILLNETDLPRPLVDHLNQVEERILEELGWLPTSNIWVYVLRTPLSRCPPFDESFFDIDSTPLFFTPLKKSKLDDDFVLPREKHNDLAIPKALKLFLRRILYIASVRLNDLCERIKKWMNQ